jgi:hypothetical membrane protein
MMWLAAGGLLTPVTDVLITVWLGTLDPNYSHLRQFMSELGEAGRPCAAVFWAWSILYGFLFAGFPIGLARGLKGHRAAWLGPGALLVVAFTSSLTGVFPCDPGCAGETVSAKMHILVGEIGTAALVSSPFLVWISMRGHQAWRGYRAFTLATGLLVALATGWLAVGYYGGMGRSAWALGAAQRVSVGILYVWMVVVTIRLWKLERVAEQGAACAEINPGQEDRADSP